MKNASTLESLLVEHYGPVDRLDAMQGGVENDVFLVKFCSGSRAVAHVYRTKTAQQVYGEIELLRLLPGRVKCAHVIEPARGEYPLAAKGHPITLTEFLEGKHIRRSALSQEAFTRIGRNLRALHDVSNDLCLRRYWGLAELIQNSQTHINILSGCARHAPFRDLIVQEQFVVQELMNEHTNYAMIHADIDESNLIHNDGHISLVDFDDCGFAPAPLDIGITLRNLIVKRLVRDSNGGGITLEDAAEAVLSGYGHNVTKLGTWLRVACFRHLNLMWDCSLCEPSYASQNRDNFRMLEIARSVEHHLNEAFK